RSHAICSLPQLCRRAGIRGDDKPRRLLVQLGEAMNDRLIEVKDRHRFALTAVGRELLAAAQRLVNLAKKGTGEDDAVELLKVAVASGVESQVLAAAVAAWLAEWDGLLTLQLQEA